MSAKNLLVELRVEELPPKALKKLGEAFGHELLAALQNAGLATGTSALTTFATPRRLAAHVSHVLAAAADKAVSVKLMPVAVGLDAAGQATPALLKKLGALGADASAVPSLARRADGKAEALFLDTVQAGATLAAGLQKALDDAIAKLPIPKVMQYQLADGWTSVNFVRPAHGLVALHGADVVPVGALGLTAGRQTQGHRFEAKMDPVVIQDADHYARQLEEQGGVVAGYAHRRAELVRQLQAAAVREGLAVIEDEALLDEVNSLIEKPNVLACRFDSEFLAVPQECLILTMKANQKYFPLLDADGRLTERFLVVSNIRPADASRVVQGNERVVRPRLADAKFFFDQDRKRTLASRVPGLAKVVYHAKLGTMGERVERVRAIARWIANRIGADEQLADQAAQLSKADLTTDMVGEFPELQGIMGGYYARHDGVDLRVADAIATQYAVQADDHSPAGVNLIAQCLLLADRVEAVVGMWSIGSKPTGDKDPFAVRRQSLGIIKVFEMIALAGSKQSLDLQDVLSVAARSFAPGLVSTQVLEEIRDYVMERYANNVSFMYTSEQLTAVLALRPPIASFMPRLNAVKAFVSMPEAASLAAANKRVGNILKKSEGAGEAAAGVDVARLVEPAERSLHAALGAVAPRADRAFEAGDLSGSLRELAALKAPVDAFFDHVMVNADDAVLRRNRLALLAELHRAMNRVADLSRLAG